MKNIIADRPIVPPLLFLLAFLVSVFIVVAEKGESPVQREFVIGEPAPRTVFSSLYLRFVDDEELARLRRERESEVLPVYTVDSKVKPTVLSRVETELQKLNSSRQPPWTQEVLAGAGGVLRLVLERFLGDGILEDKEKKELLDSGKGRVNRFDPERKSREGRLVKDLAGLSEAKEKAAVLLEKEGLKDDGLRAATLEIFTKLVQPNLFFDEAETRGLLREAAGSVAPVVEEVKRGEMVTQKGLLVTRQQQQRLIQIQKKMVAKQVQSRLLSVSLFVLLGLGLTFLYLRYFEPKTLRSSRFLTLILSVLLVPLAIEKITLLIPGGSYYLLPGALAAILLTLLWNVPLGVLGALVSSIFSAPLTDFRSEIILTLLLGSLVGSFVARGIRKRTQFLKVGLVVGVVNGAVLVAFFSFQDAGFSDALNFASLGLANGFLATALAFFLVPVYEYLFNLTTDITLLELSDLNHPLLKRMVVEAPGTYHHSLVVSTLAETACEAIGANALLARVGCYFHDIGKIARSEYFTENQTPQTRAKHDKLTPTMSCLVIMSHVKEGIELAKKYKLKDVITRFIPEHQGTGVIYYFYKKALDQAGPGEKIHADEFRYAGPKPQSRETAVAMLADSTEATSRSLKEITPVSIRNLVRKVINEKFIDGQLDECDLTLRDLFRIQESFVQNLTAIFHTRVTYPAAQPDPRRPDLFESDQFRKFHED